MNLGRICAVTFADAAAAFVIGMMMGALILYLVIAKDKP